MERAHEVREIETAEGAAHCSVDVGHDASDAERRLTSCRIISRPWTLHSPVLDP